MKITVIVPTYLEKDNIALLIPKIKENLKTSDHQVDILVVDDTSPDGTGEIVGKLMLSDKNLHLLLGNKLGLGAAYIRGMKYALEKLNPEVIVEMDADFSHDPKDLPRLIAQIKAGSDFVIGSRYIKGGKLPEGWALWRKLNSRWGNRFARYVAGLKNVADCTAGFRAVRVDVLKKIDLEALNIKGYSFQMRLLFESYKHGAIIKEIPVEFIERKRGKTKLGFWDVVEFIVDSFRIRKERLVFEKETAKILSRKGTGA